MLSRILFISIASLLSQDHVSAHFHDDELEGADRHHFHSHGLRSTPALSNVAAGNQTSIHRDLSIINSVSRCGSRDPSQEWAKKSAQIMSKWLSNQRLGLNLASTVDISTYFHVITSGSEGSISNAQLQQQIQVMNDSYRPYGFSFTLKGTTRTDNSDWYSSAAFSTEDETMKTALRVGGASTLNVYFRNTGRILGYATFPEEYTSDPKLDGVVILQSSIPGSDDTRYNEGKTLVHETGHWLGLYHTFQAGDSLLQYIPFFKLIWNGCLTSGDMIDDTPAQRSATYGCPTGKNTCLFQSGKDPIHNYMDYSDDSCYSEFTAGQTDRMLAMWSEYRAGR
jgi:Pregnancy-associated plasma protein-A